MWRVLTQLPTLISEIIGHLRTLSYLTQQMLLLQQETNQLLRELIVKVTTQPAETLPAVILTKPPDPPLTPSLLPKTRQSPAPVGYRIRTERDITRNTRSTIAADQFEAESRKQFPHRVLPPDALPTSPRQSPTPDTLPRPLGTPPNV